MKGGYKIIDFKNVSLSDTPVTMADVLVDLLNNYDKVVLLSNVVLSGSTKDDCFSTVLSDGAGGVKLNCYDGYISITSEGAVTYTVASASGMAGDIAELQGDLADTNNMIAPAWSATATYTKNNIVRDDGKLYKAKSDVPTGTVTSNTTYWSDYVVADTLSELSIRAIDLTRVSENLNGNARCLRYGKMVKITADIEIVSALSSEEILFSGAPKPNPSANISNRPIVGLLVNNTGQRMVNVDANGNICALYTSAFTGYVKLILDYICE